MPDDSSMEVLVLSVQQVDPDSAPPALVATWLTDELGDAYFGTSAVGLSIDAPDSIKITAEGTGPPALADALAEALRQRRFAGWRLVTEP